MKAFRREAVVWEGRHRGGGGGGGGGVGRVGRVGDEERVGGEEPVAVLVSNL